MPNYNRYGFERELRELVLKNKSLNKTLWRKIRRVIINDEELFKSSNEVAISKYNFKQLKIKSTCYSFVKSGFFKREKLSGTFKISDIVRVHSYTSNSYKMYLNDGSDHIISEFDFDCLSEIFS